MQRKSAYFLFLAVLTMAKHTTLRVGGPAQFWVEPRTEEAFAELIRFCRREDLALFVVGRGSNLLVRDGGIEGVVVHPCGGEFDDISVSGIEITSGVGAKLKQVAYAGRDSGIGGLEWMEGIPGEVGGALRMNAGAMRIGFDDLLAALRGGGGRCLFGFGESDSDNRAHQALAQALKNPLMDRGRSLAAASSVLVQITGGPGMTLSEVEVLMRDLNKHIGEETQLLFGTAVDGRMGDRLSVTLLSSLPVEGTEITPRKPKRPVAATAPPPEPVIETPTVESFVEPEAANIPATIELEPPQPVFEEPENLQPEPVIEENLSPREMPEATPLVEAHMEEEPPPQPPTPRIIPPKKKPLIAPNVEPENTKREKAAARQEVLQFEPVTRGRFEKSEPTIVEGQDLDVPTFLRKNIRVK